jgi:GT2 family glycosyltransferase
MLAESLASLFETAGDLVGELVVVVGPEADGAAVRAAAHCWPHARIVTDPAPFNFARRVNVGVATTQAPWILWWNDDVVALGPGWLEAMLAAGGSAGVGAVGAVLRYSDGTVQHAGVRFSNGLPGHLGEEAIPAGPVAKVSAVTGACLLTRRDHFDAVGGLCLDLPLNYNDIDYCLKLRRVGLRCVVARDAQLRHDESQTRTPVLEDREVQLLVARWWFELNEETFWPHLAPLHSATPTTDPR